MSKRTLFLQAVDALIFRDGKPFDIGGGYRAQSLFPPFPTTIQGALRSHELVLAGIDLHNQNEIEAHVGNAFDSRSFRFMGTFLALRDVSKIIVYLPIPANAVPEEGQGWRCLLPDDPPANVFSNFGLPKLLWSNFEPVKHHGFGDWLTLEDWREFWDGKPVRGRSSSDFFLPEPRFGIALQDAKRTVEESQLYEAEFVRLSQGVGLLSETEGFNLPGWDSGLLRMGGEGHAAAYETVNDVTWPDFPTPLPGKFALCFITPTYFKAGWQPEHGDWSRFFDGPVELISAAFSRPQSVGGFDFAKFKKNRQDPEAHKAIKKFIPAGSVYFFENHGANAPQKAFVTDEGERFGFGRILIQGV